MNKQQIIAQQSGIIERREALLALAESENRDLNQAEQSEYRKLDRQLDKLDHQLRLIAMPDEVRASRRMMDVIAEAVRDIANGKSMDKYGDLVKGEGTVAYRSGASDSLVASMNVDSITPDMTIEFVEPLQSRLLINKLGCKIISGVIGKAKYPTVNNVTCYVEGENTKLKDQVLKFDGKDASPKRVGLNIPFSNRAVRNATLDLLSYARKVEVQAAAQLLNKWMFSTTTIEGCSAGPFVAPFAEATEKEKGALAFEDIVSLETTIEAKDVVIDETAAYVVHPTIYGFLKTTKLDEGSGKFLIEGGMMNGYPVLRSSHVSEKVIGFGVFSNVDVLQYGDVDVTVDQLTRKNENITQVMFQTDYDIVTVRQEAFACIKIA